MSTTTTIASSLAPPFSMVSKYFAASVASFVVLCGLLVLNYADIQGHHFQPKLLALTHVATLGWVTMIIFGAMFQLVPVVLEVKLFSARLGEVQFWLFLAGVVGLVYGFWTFNVGLHLAVSASVVTLSMFLFVTNMLLTMGTVSKWNLTGHFLLAALFYLAVTSVAGLLLSINLGFPFIGQIHLDYLKIHAHLGFVGWVVMVIMGVGLKLFPMFGLSHGFSTVPARIAFVAVNVGLMGTTVEWLLTGPPWLLHLYIAILVGGILCFVVQLLLIFKHRLRRVLDLGMRHSAVAFGYLFVSTGLGAFIAFVNVGSKDSADAVVLLYGFVILIGFFSTLIVGQMYKIVPFLVWFHTFSDKVGKEPVPMLKDMFSEKIGNAQFLLLNFGLLCVFAGVLGSWNLLLLAGFAFLFTASLLFAFNIVTVLRLRFRYGNKRTDS